jgi:hypothetical protein
MLAPALWLGGLLPAARSKKSGNPMLLATFSVGATAPAPPGRWPFPPTGQGGVRGAVGIVPLPKQTAPLLNCPGADVKVKEGLEMGRAPASASRRCSCSGSGAAGSGSADGCWSICSRRRRLPSTSTGKNLPHVTARAQRPPARRSARRRRSARLCVASNVHHLTGTGAALPQRITLLQLRG